MKNIKVFFIITLLSTFVAAFYARSNSVFAISALPAQQAPTATPTSTPTITQATSTQTPTSSPLPTSTPETFSVVLPDPSVGPKDKNMYTTTNNFSTPSFIQIFTGENSQTITRGTYNVFQNIISTVTNFLSGNKSTTTNQATQQQINQNNETPLPSIQTETSTGQSHFSIYSTITSPFITVNNAISSSVKDFFLSILGVKK